MDHARYLAHVESSSPSPRLSSPVLASKLAAASQSQGLPVKILPQYQNTNPQRVTLSNSSGTTVLQPLLGSHATALHCQIAGLGNASLWTYMPDGPYDDYMSFAEAIRDKAISEDPLFFTVVVNGVMVGYISLMRFVGSARCVEVGHVMFGKALQRTREATEVFYMLFKYCFEELGIRRLEWKCNDLNEPSKRAAVRLGFTPEGVFRQHMIVKGRNRDTAWFSMLDTEWSANKQAFERWLDDANVDAARRQKKSLVEVRAAVSAMT